MTLTTTKQNELTVSELINVHIPRTNDRGDALQSAVAICKAAHSAMCADRSIAFEYQVFGAKITMRLAAQHLDYLKGGN